MAIDREWKSDGRSFAIMYLDNNMNPVDESRATCYKFFWTEKDGSCYDAFGTVGNGWKDSEGHLLLWRSRPWQQQLFVRKDKSVTI